MQACVSTVHIILYIDIVFNHGIYLYASGRSVQVNLMLHLTHSKGAQEERKLYQNQI